MSLTNSNRFRTVVQLEIKDLSRKPSVGRTQIHFLKPVSNPLDKWFRYEKNLKNFDPGSILDRNFRVESAGNHLYQIGLSFQQFGGGKRLPLHHPYSNLIIYFIMIIHDFLSLVIPDNYFYFHLYICDYAHILKIKYHWNPALFLLLAVEIFSILINYHDHYRGREQDHLNFFGVYSGVCTPQSMGLTDHRYVMKTCKMLKHGIVFFNMLLVNVYMFCLTLTLLPLVTVYEW